MVRRETGDGDCDGGKKRRSGGGGGESLWWPLMEGERERSHVRKVESEGGEFKEE